MNELRAVVDRIEGKMAVLLLGDEEHRIILPASYLPEEATEGAVLKLVFEVDAEATRDAKKRVQDLIDRLSGGDG
jgi:hypothetical protein